MDFERDSAYHLTGISADMRSSGSGTTVAPVRHGVRFIETALSDDEMRYIVPLTSCVHCFTSTG
jgi:hypothetical protein